MDYAGRVAFLTGGGSGPGEATARRLAAGGARVAVADMNREAAERVAGEAGGLGVGVDATDAPSVEAAFATAARKLGEAPRIVVNCAGIGTASRILPRDGSLTVATF